jgi:hypothetical protein
MERGQLSFVCAPMKGRRRTSRHSVSGRKTRGQMNSSIVAAAGAAVLEGIRLAELGDRWPSSTPDAQLALRSRPNV